MIKQIIGGSFLLALVTNAPATTSALPTQQNTVDSNTAQWQRERAAYERDMAYSDLYQDDVTGNKAYESSLIEAMYHLGLARVNALTLHNAASTRTEIERARQYIHTAEQLGDSAERERLQNLESRFQRQFASYLQGKACVDDDPKAFSKVSAGISKAMNNS